MICPEMGNDNSMTKMQAGPTPAKKQSNKWVNKKRTQILNEKIHDTRVELKSQANSQHRNICRSYGDSSHENRMIHDDSNVL